METKQQTVFENIRNKKDEIEYILKKFPETRNSDKELITRMALTFNYSDPLDLYEVVRRTRQQFNSRGQYLPTSREVAIQRKLNIEAWQKALGYGGTLF